jgi:hypothetical protein
MVVSRTSKKRGLLQREIFEGAGLLRKRGDLPKPQVKLGAELERRDGGRKEFLASLSAGENL